MRLANCPQCAQPTRADLLEKMGGICPPCLAGFVLTDSREDAVPLDDAMIRALERVRAGRQQVPRESPAMRSRVLVATAAAFALALVGYIILSRPTAPSSPVPAAAARPTSTEAPANPRTTSWRLTNADDLARIGLDGEIVVGKYRDRKDLVYAWAPNLLPSDYVLRFRLRYEVDPGDEPWIFVALGPRRLVMFPEGNHVMAIAVDDAAGPIELMDDRPMPVGHPAPGRWSDVEVRWSQATRQLQVTIDGQSAFSVEAGELGGGAWGFAFGGATREVRVGDVRLSATR